jgi:hypothetical protein
MFTLLQRLRHSTYLRITYVLNGNHRKPEKTIRHPLISIFQPAKDEIGPGERAQIDLGVGFRFPDNATGLLLFKPGASTKWLQMQTKVVSK